MIALLLLFFSPAGVVLMAAGQANPKRKRRW